MKVRFRSTATFAAMAALLTASSLWIQDPASGVVSLSWKTAAGQVVSAFYTSAYVSAVAAMLAAVTLSLIGFHLVSGSIERDRRSGVGTVIAATPLSNAAYLLGRWCANACYLMVLAAIALVTGMVAFGRFGTGPFRVFDFVATFVLIVAPAVAFTAALAILFDVIPALAGRGGQVAYFFLWLPMMLMVPMLLHGEFPGQQRRSGVPLYDPQGTVALRTRVYATFDDVKPGSISVGLQRPSSLQRVPWSAPVATAGLAAGRALAALWAALPIVFALGLFDRFDPAAAHGRRAAARAGGTRGTTAAAAGKPQTHSRPWRPLPTSPSAIRSALGEARLTWDMGSWLKWPLLASAVASGVWPAATYAMLLLLAPLVADAAAREARYGTGGLVFSTAGVSSTRVLWKAAAAAILCAGLGLPALIRAFSQSAQYGLALLFGLAFMALFSTSAASLTGGPKTFLALYTPLWYLSLNGAAVGAVDFAGLGRGGAGVSTPLAYAGASVLALALSVIFERRRRRG